MSRWKKEMCFELFFRNKNIFLQLLQIRRVARKCTEDEDNISKASCRKKRIVKMKKQKKQWDTGKAEMPMKE